MSTTVLPRLAERVLGRPLLVTPSLAELIYGVIEGRISPETAGVAPALLEEAPPAPEASRFIGSRARQGGGARLNRVSGSTALITVDGSLVNRGAWVGADICTGLVSYEGIAAQIREAEADDEITSVVLDINSGGGEANGMYATAAAIQRLAKTKYVVAVVNDVAGSAAYGLSSAADEILISPTSLVGSIGVVMLHLDRSAELAAKGVRPTLIHAGAHKVDGHPFGPLPESVREAMQRDAMAFYDRFLETVEAGRGRSRLSAKAARATEARTFIGQDAIDAGLADRMGTVESILAELNRPRRRRATQPKGSKAMKPENDTAPAASLSAETIEALASATASATATAVTSALEAAGITQKPEASAEKPADADEAVKADRKRMADIRALPEAKGREGAALTLAEQGLSVEAAKATLESLPIAASAPAPADRGPQAEICTGSEQKPQAEEIRSGWAKAFNKGGKAR